MNLRLAAGTTSQSLYQSPCSLHCRAGSASVIHRRKNRAYYVLKAVSYLPHVVYPENLSRFPSPGVLKKACHGCDKTWCSTAAR